MLFSAIIDVTALSDVTAVTDVMGSVLTVLSLLSLLSLVKCCPCCHYLQTERYWLNIILVHGPISMINTEA